jgi:hypothetical protein
LNAKLKTIAIVRLKVLKSKQRFRVYMDRGAGDMGGLMIVNAVERAERRARRIDAVIDLQRVERSMLMGYRGDQMLEIRPETVYAPYIPLYMTPDPQVIADNREFARRMIGSHTHSTESHMAHRFTKVYRGPGYPIDPKLQEERDRVHLFSVLPQ